MALIRTVAYQCQGARGGDEGKSSSTLLQGPHTDQPVGNERVPGLCGGGFARSGCVEECHCLWCGFGGSQGHTDTCCWYCTGRPAAVTYLRTGELRGEPSVVLTVTPRNSLWCDGSSSRWMFSLRKQGQAGLWQGWQIPPLTLLPKALGFLLAAECVGRGGPSSECPDMRRRALVFAETSRLLPESAGGV